MGRKIKHGKSGTRIYRIYINMKHRCYSKKADSYVYYGARGISVCEEWLKSFEVFQDWALANGYSDNLSIDRIDANGNYCPENCRWVTIDVQNKNKRHVSIIVADGKDAVWVEFGAGVYHNGSVGSSPHPKGVELGYTIGSYGKGYGKGRAWGYYDESGVLHITRGTPATMPMYNATKSIIDKAVSIARESCKWLNG